MYRKIRSHKLYNAAHSSDWPVYRIFGITLNSDFPFANRLAKGTDPPNLSFSCIKQPPIPLGWTQAAPSYASSFRTVDGESVVYLHRLDTCDVLRFTRAADFYLWPDRILCHLLDPAYDYLVEIFLLGTVLSFWLERQGTPVLHASAISIDGRAAVFLSRKKGGKSALAAILMQAGYPLLTDDILPVEQHEKTFLGRPGYANMRMWPGEAQYFLDHFHDLEIIHPAFSKRRVPVGPPGFGTFCNRAQSLTCLYLPERRHPGEKGTQIEITPVSPAAAVIELVRHSFTGHILEALGWQRQRLDFFTQLVNQVPLRRLTYPSGFDHLPRVREAILEDI
ncbi:MAG: hypothetical protein JSV88_20155 [Candidatus Aminicenantes bacterium]|nr:MAG: hypothetical protein JSV88_20155 [Candidatus Aminicenantes bacterium]